MIIKLIIQNNSLSTLKLLYGTEQAIITTDNGLVCWHVYASSGMYGSEINFFRTIVTQGEWNTCIPF